MRTLIANAEVEGQIVSVVIENAKIAQLSFDQSAIRGEFSLSIDAAGGALLPGLHDHHVHLLAMAARRNGVDVDVVAAPADFDDVIRSAAETSDGEWVRVAGYDEHRHGALDIDRLNDLAGDVRVRVQHRSGLVWMLSASALNDVLEGLSRSDIPEGVERTVAGDYTGRLLRLDHWLAQRVGVVAPSFVGLGADLSALGLTGVTDATPDLGAGRTEVLRTAAVTGLIPQRLVLLGVDETEILGDQPDLGNWARVGPAKIVIDEVSGLDPDALAATIALHHENGRAVAVHAVSRAETVTVATAFAIAGIRQGDRIEHGSVLPFDLDPLLAHSGLTVVVQPGLIRERGDYYLESVDAEDRAALHRAASLLEAGISVAVGSDAPVTSIDPWATIAAAAARTTNSGRVLGADERVAPLTALNWYLTDPLSPAGPVRRVREGVTADLCLLDRSLARALETPSAHSVRMTWINGRMVHS